MAKIKGHLKLQYQDPEDQPQDQFQAMLRFVQKKRSKEVTDGGIMATACGAQLRQHAPNDGYCCANAT
jgi:hypothetical protein